MIKQLFFTFLLLFFIYACSREEKPAVAETKITEATETKTVEVQLPKYETAVFLVSTDSKAPSWGYNILLDNNIFIHQATIPSVQGNQSFRTQQDAENTARLVVYKLNNNIMPPSISRKELDSLQIHIENNN